MQNQKKVKLTRKTAFSLMKMGNIFLSAGAIGVLGMGQYAFAAPASDVKSSTKLDYSQYLNELRKHPQRKLLMFSGLNTLQPYTVIVHSSAILPLLKGDYTEPSLDAIAKATVDTRKIEVKKHPWGTFVQAASFASNDMASETNYDAIWVRDSVWGYLALDSQAETQADAHQVLLTLWDYMAIPAQIDRMKVVIADPAILNGPDGQMKAVHIRFNSASKDFADVMEKGKPQSWTHKQNDALGLFIDATLNEVKAGKIKADEWNKGKRLDALIYLVGYLDKAKFYAMEDSGAWEESARLNTSSVGLVTSALENLQKMIDAPSDTDKAFVHALQERANQLQMGKVISSDNLKNLVDEGYQRVAKQLGQGGESPDYEKTNPNYRQADAALLNLIYPAKLSRLTMTQKKRILDIVAPLMGDVGIRRYVNDDYQSANFWFHNIKTDTDSASHAERKKQFIPGTEAQWFFDSWYAKAALMVYHQNKDPHYRAIAVRSINRALAQITGPKMLGANAQGVPNAALPESYNFIADKGQLWEAASPITPLNWAKASMTLMLQEAKSDLK